MVEIHAHRAGPLSNGIAVHAEQTLPAFVRTWSEHRVVCELDVRFTADGVAVVFHDPDLMRMTGTPGLLHELDAAAFMALRTDILGTGRQLALAAAPVPFCGWRVARGPASTWSSRTCPAGPGSTPRTRPPDGSPASCAARGSLPTG